MPPLKKIYIFLPFSFNIVIGTESFFDYNFKLRLYYGSDKT